LIYKQKELAADAEAAGGLSVVTAGAHGITDFCNRTSSVSSQKLGLYGVYKSKRCHSVRNKLQHWLGLGYVEYRDLVVAGKFFLQIALSSLLIKNSLIDTGHLLLSTSQVIFKTTAISARNCLETSTKRK